VLVSSRNFGSKWGRTSSEGRLSAGGLGIIEGKAAKLAPWMNWVDVRVVVGRSKLLEGES